MKVLGGINILGLTLAAYSTAAMVSAPFIGFLDEKLNATKSIVFLSGIAKIVGNLLYSIPVNGYFPLFGRFLIGIGEEAAGVLCGVVTKCTTKESCTKAFLYFEGLFPVGSVSGQAIESVFTFNVDILGKFVNFTIICLKKSKS